MIRHSTLSGRIASTWAIGMLALVASSTAISRVEAQSTSYTTQQRAEMMRRVPVTLIASDALPAGTSGAAIVRRAMADPHDIIVVASTATPTQLSGALFTLVATREVAGDTARVDGTVRASSTGAPAAWDGRELQKVQGMLRNLRKAVPRPVSGYGVVPAYDVYLLPHAFRGKMTPSAKATGQ